MPPLSLPPVLDPLVERLGGPRRALIAAVGLLTVVLVLALSRWATAPTWVPLSSSMPLELVGDVTQRLGEEGIPFRLEQGGAQILVPASELARARVGLAQQGLPNTGRPGMELFDQPSWGMTDFAQRINYRRALEGELERTIGKMRGVEAAKVHLALNENSSFRAPDRPLEASVVLKLQGAQQPASDVVQGIQHLVASSVDGLESQKVTVVDHSGRLLSLPDEPGSIAALSNRQLGMQREVESYLERKAEEMVSQVVGPGNVRIRVAAAINFDRVERTLEVLDPDGQVIAAEQRSEIVPGPEGGAGSVTSSANYENSRRMESFSGAIGNVKRLSVAVLVNEKQVAPGADAVARTPQELQQIEMLVRNAVGVDEERGDVVSVASLAFSPVDDAFAEPTPDVWTIIERVHKPVLTLLALLLCAFVAVRALRTLREPAVVPVEEPGQAAAALQPGNAAAEDEVPTLQPGEDEPQYEERPDALPAGAEMPQLAGGAGSRAPALIPALSRNMISTANSRMRNQVLETLAERPEAAARVARAWLKEG